MYKFWKIVCKTKHLCIIKKLQLITSIGVSDNINNIRQCSINDISNLFNDDDLLITYGKDFTFTYEFNDKTELKSILLQSQNCVSIECFGSNDLINWSKQSELLSITNDINYLVNNDLTNLITNSNKHKFWRVSNILTNNIDVSHLKLVKSNVRLNNVNFNVNSNITKTITNNSNSIPTSFFTNTSSNNIVLNDDSLHILNFYVGCEFDEDVEVTNVDVISDDNIIKYVVEYSDDGLNWLYYGYVNNDINNDIILNDNDDGYRYYKVVIDNKSIDISDMTIFTDTFLYSCVYSQFGLANSINVNYDINSKINCNRIIDDIKSYVVYDFRYNTTFSAMCLNNNGNGFNGVLYGSRDFLEWDYISSLKSQTSNDIAFVYLESQMQYEYTSSVYSDANMQFIHNANTSFLISTYQKNHDSFVTFNTQVKHIDYCGHTYTMKYNNDNEFKLSLSNKQYNSYIDGTVSGVYNNVKEPLQRFVYCNHFPSGQFVGRTTSKKDGTFTFYDLDLNSRYTVFSIDTSKTWNDDIEGYGILTPISYED